MSENLDEKSTAARDWENKAREALREKLYDEAITFFEEAIDIYTEIGWQGQVGILKKEISRVENLKSFFQESAAEKKQRSDTASRKEEETRANNLLRKAKDAQFQQNLDEAHQLLTEAREIFEKLDYSYQVKKIDWEINKIGLLKEKQAEASVEATSIAEKRAQRLREAREAQTREEEARIKEREDVARKTTESRLKNLGSSGTRPAPVGTGGGGYQDARQREKDEQRARLRALQEKKRREEALQQDADALMDKGKQLADQGQYSQARETYMQAADKFAELGWKEQEIVIRKEIRLLVQREKEDAEKHRFEAERKREQEEAFQQKMEKMQKLSAIEQQKRKEEEEKRLAEIRRKRDEEFQKRQEKLLEEQRERERREEEARLARDPVYQALVRKRKLAARTVKKAEKLVENGKKEEAIERLKYALEIHDEIDSPREEINALQAKIDELSK